LAVSYNFTTGEELLILCERTGLGISEIMQRREVVIGDRTREGIREHMHHTLDVMKSSIANGVMNTSKSVGGLIGGEAAKLKAYIEKGSMLSCEGILVSAMNSMAVLELNANMGKIVACPTAGSSGVLPGTIVSKGMELGKSDDDIVDSLFTASAVGYIIARNATVSGAEGGCQAETGSASAMGAAGLVEMMGGTPEMALSAASFTIKNILGLVCDPIAGLVECPCQKRNSLASVNSIISADMALAGIETIVPFDEVVEAMYKVGKLLPASLRETALGGMADTETGRRITKQIFG
jgi:L-serine dehydratase